MAIDTSPNVAFCGKLEISEMEGIAHEMPQKAGGWRDRPAWVGACSSEPEQEPAMQPARRAGAVYRTMAGGLSAVAAGALRVRFGQRRASDDPQSSPGSTFGGDWQQIERTMSENNPYRAFVDSFARLLTEGEPLGSAAPVRPTRPAVVAGARTALIFAPHPDDEVIIGGLPLRLLRELKINVVNVAVTLGSRVDRQAERWQELKNCCDYIGFGLVAPAERGLEGINPAAKDKDPQGGPRRSRRSPGF